jgi:glycosyltransferase involved in cell wall biosynthesis
MRVIYACPFSHYSGHHPHVATVEPKMLSENGIEAILVTFCGVTNNPDVGVEHHKTTPNLWILDKIRKFAITRWFLMLFETFATLIKALTLYYSKKADAIIVRDGEPFLFTSFLISLPFTKMRWVISLTAANLVAPKASISQVKSNPFLTIYTLVMNFFINNPLWRHLYAYGIKKHSYILCPQNEKTKSEYAEYMGGVFKDNLRVIEWGIKNNVELVSKEEARYHLGIPQDAKVLLSFGAPHSGKDTETMFKALAELPDIWLVHGGIQAFSLGTSPETLVKKYNIKNCKIFNSYIPEDEKKYFFCAADAAILSYYKIFKSTSSMLWECSQYQLPVISSDANTLGAEVNRWNVGLVFEAENHQSLIKEIDKFFCLDNNIVNQFKEGQKSFISEYSGEKWADNYRKAIEAVHV